MSLEFAGILICLALIAIWIVAELTADDKAKHRELRRLREMELGRMRQRADYIESGCFYHREPRA